VIYERIEPETETHRNEKALGTLVPGARLPLERGTVAVAVQKGLEGTPGGQHLVTLLVHLLARMKGIVRNVTVDAGDAPRLPGVLLPGETLQQGLAALVEGLSGPRSVYRCGLEFGMRSPAADVRVAVGDQAGDIHIGADGWRALIGRYVEEARWQDASALGPYMAATIGASDVLKVLLRLNFGWSDGRLVGDSAFSLFNYRLDEQAGRGPNISSIRLRDLAIAGAGAGGTAALYTILSFPDVSGEVVVVEPGYLKTSSLGRYLMTNYEQVYNERHKLDSVMEFIQRYAAEVQVEGESTRWHEVKRNWKIVLSTVDTPEARWDVQRSKPTLILDGGVIGTIYAILRVMPGGWCLECKHPPDPDVTWKRRALRWGLSVDEVRTRYRDQTPVSHEDIERLAEVQAKPVDTFLSLEGLPFDQLPALTECGETPLLLAIPSQAPVLPIATTAAGIVLAAEVVKELNDLREPLHNYLTHDLRFRPKPEGYRFKARTPNCPGCQPLS
jgi:hypothetical protein